MEPGYLLLLALYSLSENDLQFTAAIKCPPPLPPLPGSRAEEGLLGEAKDPNLPVEVLLNGPSCALLRVSKVFRNGFPFVVVIIMKNSGLHH